MSNRKCLFLIICLTLFFAITANAVEYINSFHSDITVNPDGSLTIVETIAVHHEGNQIKRGIYRDLSIKKGEHYTILGVKRNNLPEPWFTEKRSNTLRLNTGNDNFLPAPADSVFEISYILYDSLRPIKGEDLNELYLNLTGKWAFKINRATAAVFYPEGTNIVRQYGYQTGLPAKQYVPNAEFLFQDLPPNAEATIAAAFSRGTVDIPLPRTIFYLAAALILTLIYYLIVWYLYGKDPAARAIVPDWEPPAGLSPLECAYIDNNGAEPANAFFLHILYLIQKKLITVQTHAVKGFFKTKTSYELITDNKAAHDGLETGLYLKNFPNRLIIDDTPDQRVTSYNKKLQTAVRKKLEGVFYRRRLFMTITGALFFPLAYTICYPDNGWFLIIQLLWILPWLSYPHILPKIIALLFLAAFICLTMASSDIFIFFLPWLAMVYVFYRLMFQPTLVGQRQKEKIDGLKMFLTAITDNNISTARQTDKNGLSMQKRLTPEDMEELFAYAVALGLENEWAQKYTAVFGAKAYQTALSNHCHFDSDFVNSLSSSCTSHASYSSGSASRGGGFAGGGFGGGGGGGR